MKLIADGVLFKTPLYQEVPIPTDKLDIGSEVEDKTIRLSLKKE